VNTPYRRAGVEDQVGFGVTHVVQVHSCQQKTDSLTLWAVHPRRVTRQLKCNIVPVLN
jgi:hypothetical protein